MAFHFRFERILDLKRRNEERCLEIWVRQDRLWKEATRAKERVAAEAAEVQARLRDLQTKNPLPLFQVRQAHAHAQDLRKQLEEAETKVRNAVLARKEARSAMRKATQERRTFEILRDNQLALYQQEENRREQQLMDEIGSTRVFRSLNEPTGGM